MSDSNSKFFAAIRQLIAGRPEFDLVLDGEVVTFRSPGELSAALAPRAQVPSHLVRLSLQFDEPRARLELERTQRLQERFD